MANDALTTAVSGYGNYGIGSQGVYDKNGNAVVSLINANNAATDPSGTLADIYRGEWSNYETVYAPLKDALESYTTYNGNSGLAPTLIENGAKNTNQVYTTMTGTQQRAASGMGIATTAREAKALGTSNALSKGMSQVNLENNARTTQSDTNREIAAGTPTTTELKNAWN